MHSFPGYRDVKNVLDFYGVTDEQMSITWRFRAMTEKAAALSHKEGFHWDACDPSIIAQMAKDRKVRPSLRLWPTIKRDAESGYYVVSLDDGERVTTGEGITAHGAMLAFDNKYKYDFNIPTAHDREARIIRRARRDEDGKLIGERSDVVLWYCRKCGTKFPNPNRRTFVDNGTLVDVDSWEPRCNHGEGLSYDDLVYCAEDINGVYSGMVSFVDGVKFP